MTDQGMPGSNRAGLVSEILAAQQEFARNVQAAGAPLWAELDLTMPQLKALLGIAYEQSMTVSQVGDVLGIGRPAASNLVDRLVHLGLVTRAEDPTDRRRTNVQLSQQGSILVARLQQGGEDMFRACLDLLSDDDVAALAHSMTALAEATRRRLAARNLVASKTASW
jgi:DNA-binding MarR family transcriptional regulator